MYRFSTICSEAVCPHTAYQIVVARRSHRLLSAQYWARLPRKVLGRYQYHPILASIGQYQISVSFEPYCWIFVACPDVAYLWLIPDWCRRSGGRHSTAVQCCYVPLGRHLVRNNFLVEVEGECAQTKLWTRLLRCVMLHCTGEGCQLIVSHQFQRVVLLCYFAEFVIVALSPPVTVATMMPATMLLTELCLEVVSEQERLLQQRKKQKLRCSRKGMYHCWVILCHVPLYWCSVNRQLFT